MNLMCRIRGHSFQDTFLIEEAGDFYEIEYGEYCNRCGEVKTHNGEDRSRYASA